MDRVNVAITECGEPVWTVLVAITECGETVWTMLMWQ